MDFDDRRLLRPSPAAREAIAALLPGMPEPPHFGQVRRILRGSDQSSSAVDRTRHAP